MPTAFEDLVTSLRPRLRRAILGFAPRDEVDDVLSEAFLYASEHWDEVSGMTNPAGYLFRVCQSRSRRRAAGFLPAPDSLGLPEVEPGLVPALEAMPMTQRTAVWLVHACGWPYAEVAEAMGTSTSTVGNHVSRALARLRADLEAQHAEH